MNNTGECKSMVDTPISISDCLATTQDMSISSLANIYTSTVSITSHIKAVNENVQNEMILKVLNLLLNPEEALKEFDDNVIKDMVDIIRKSNNIPENNSIKRLTDSIEQEAYRRF